MESRWLKKQQEKKQNDIKLFSNISGDFCDLESDVHFCSPEEICREERCEPGL